MSLQGKETLYKYVIKINQNYKSTKKWKMFVRTQDVLEKMNGLNDI